MKRRGATPEEDRAMGLIEEGPITSVEPNGDGSGWSVTVNGWTCGVKADRCPVEPKVGDKFTTYGGIGYAFHGQALNGELLWYRTPEEERAENERQNAEADQRKRDEFEQNRATLDAAYSALPETFQQRIDKFRRTNPDFRWEFESYEMGCCTDALKVASYCSINRVAIEFEGDEPTAAENVVAYGNLPWEEQKKAGVSNGHSGNSFGFVVRLAYLWVSDPGMVVAEHGALTPLVGCKDYGCPHPETLADASDEEEELAHSAYPEGTQDA